MIRSAGFDELDARTLYRILRLRSEVFVVEQECAYPDIDGRDTEPDALHLWAEPDPASPIVAAALRVLVEPDGTRRIGRVVTAGDQRGQGLAGLLMDEALGLIPPAADIVLDAQSRLEQWYEGWGFARSGDDFVEDGIVHVPMRLVGGTRWLRLPTRHGR
jgi:ElaA protein